MLIRFAFSVTGTAKFLSHLDLVQVFARAVKRAKLPIAYSQGFNPHPLINLGPPRGVAVAGLCEYCDMELKEDMYAEAFEKALASAMPRDIKVFAAKTADKKQGALMAIINAATYEVEVENAETAFLDEAIEKLKNAEHIMCQRTHPKKGVRTVDIRPYIYDLQRQGDGKIFMEVAIGNNGNVRPVDVIEAFGIGGLKATEILRTGLYIRDEKGNKLKP
jgi:radical SAM-linked protein